MRILVPLLLALTLLATAAIAAEEDTKDRPTLKSPAAVFTPSPSGWYAEVRGGFATQDFADLDANIGYMERIATENLAAPGAFRRFEDAQAFAVELGRRRGHWGCGVTTEQQRQRVRTFAAGDSTGSLDAISLMSTIDVRLVLSFRPEKLYGFEIGASAGMAFAHYSEQFSLQVFPAPQFDANFSGAYHAASFSGGPHLGWRRPLHGNTWFVARGTWLWRNFDELTGQYKSRFAGGTTITDGSLRRLDNGALAAVDGSSLQLTAGLSYTFGGRR